MLTSLAAGSRRSHSSNRRVSGGPRFTTTICLYFTVYRALWNEAKRHAILSNSVQQSVASITFVSTCRNRPAYWANISCVTKDGSVLRNAMTQSEVPRRTKPESRRKGSRRGTFDWGV